MELPLERGLVDELRGSMLRRGLDVWIYTQKHWFVPRLSGPQVRENSDCFELRLNAIRDLMKCRIRS